MNREKLIEKIRELNSKQTWNHSIELLPGVFTCSPEQVSAGKNLVKWGRMKAFLNSFSCSDKRILDIGCNDGFFSLKLAELGAHIVALEASNERVEKARFVFDFLNVSKQIELIKTNIYDFRLDSLGSFDLVLCMGFLHRVPDPFTLLSMLAPLSDTLLLDDRYVKLYRDWFSFLYYTKNENFELASVYQQFKDEGMNRMLREFRPTLKPVLIRSAYKNL